MPHTLSRTPHMQDEQGQTIAEYALLVAFIAVTVALILPLFGATISGLFDPLLSVFGGP